MLSEESVERLLEVMAEFYFEVRTADSVQSAYNSSVKRIASRHGVRQATMADLSTRRIGLRSHSLCLLLGAWSEGRPQLLIEQIKKQADESSHARIDHFFSQRSTAVAEG